MQLFAKYCALPWVNDHLSAHTQNHVDRVLEKVGVNWPTGPRGSAAPSQESNADVKFLPKAPK